jgi:hypothetical protein
MIAATDPLAPDGGPRHHLQWRRLNHATYTRLLEIPRRTAVPGTPTAGM